MEERKLTHVDENGAARMVDVSPKARVKRTARARAKIDLDPGTVRRMIEAHVAGRENYSHQLWALLVFEIWRDNYL